MDETEDKTKDIVFLSNPVSTGQLRATIQCQELKKDITFHILVHQTNEIQHIINFITDEAISDNETN